MNDDSNVLDDLNSKPETELFDRNVAANHIKVVDTMMLTCQAVPSVVIHSQQNHSRTTIRQIERQKNTLLFIYLPNPHV